jgi:putative transcriptional regulator
MGASLKGKLLVATPLIGDPNFERTVVLLLEHNDEGALGVVLNRPSDVELLGPLPEWDRFAAHPSVVFVGGPVSREAVIALARVRPGVEEPAWVTVSDRVAAVDLNRDPDEVGGRVETVRFFAGYAGWAPGQLEDEIEAGAWFVVEARPGDTFAADPENLWRRVLRRQGGTTAMFANFPDDPTQN